GTALFALSGTTADYPPGPVRYDGTTVTVDVTSLIGKTQGLLVFQLLGSDGAAGSVVHIGGVSPTANPPGQVAAVFPQPTTPPAPPPPAGPALDPGGLGPADGLHLLVGDVRYDATANLYTADLRLRDEGPAIGRQADVVFTGLPDGVQLQGPSGTDASGRPYI